MHTSYMPLGSQTFYFPAQPFCCYQLLVGILKSSVECTPISLAPTPHNTNFSGDRRRDCQVSGGLASETKLSLSQFLKSLFMVSFHRKFKKAKRHR